MPRLIGLAGIYCTNDTARPMYFIMLSSIVTLILVVHAVRKLVNYSGHYPSHFEQGVIATLNMLQLPS
jgi:hypothetical protein